MIVVIARRTRAPSPQRSPAPQETGIARDTLTTSRPALSWNPPSVDPCALVGEAEVESLVGPLSAGPKPGGSALDGTSCAYVGIRPIVVSLGLISTAVFEAGKSEPNLTFLHQVGDEAYVIRPNSFDTNLLVRQGKYAVMVKVTADSSMAESTRLHLAIQLSEKALDRLNNT